MWTEPNHITFGLIFIPSCMCIVIIREILVALSTGKIDIPSNKLLLSGSTSSCLLRYVLSKL